MRRIQAYLQSTRPLPNLCTVAALQLFLVQVYEQTHRELSRLGARGWERPVTHAAYSRLNARGDAVTYFCFIESTILSVPHMEPLIADDLDEATLEAEALLDQHASGYAAHVFEDNERVASVWRPERVTPQVVTDQPSA